MKVLVGCEESGTVRDEFLRLGHDAMSCDLQPTRKPGPHYQGDIFDVIDYPWDLALFYPPCTHTCVSGARHFAEKRMDGRQQAGIAFIMALERRSQHISRTCFEQPVSILSSLWRRPDQIIHPHQFGHPETKTTCLWLKRLPRLTPTNDVGGGRLANRIHRMAPSPTRSRDRSETYPGIARAKAEQWGCLLEMAA